MRTFCVPDLCKNISVGLLAILSAGATILKAIADDLASKHMAIGCQAWIRLVRAHSTKIQLVQSSRSWIEFFVGDLDIY